MKRGFTLIELLIVIAIIGVLAGVLASKFGGVRRNAANLDCKGKLKTLGQAAMAYHTNSRVMPAAGSYEVMHVTLTGELRFYEFQGWVAWTGKGQWVNKLPQRGMMKSSVWWGDGKVDDLSINSITNGALWNGVNRNLDAYVCDGFRAGAAEKFKMDKNNVRRGYVMNQIFGWDSPEGENPNERYDPQRGLDQLPDNAQPSKTLMFAEIHEDDLAKSGTGADSVLQWRDDERIGFWHIVDKKPVAHVCFADGHVEALLDPGEGNQIEYTRWLCSGGLDGQQF